MIAELSIQHLVLAEEVELQLDAGLVALTGETGAGKSLIGQALDLVTGGRAQSGMVRRGEETARIDLALEFTGPQREAIDAELAELGLPATESGRVVVRRELKAAGGTRAWVGGAAVSLRTLTALWKHRLRRIDQGATTIFGSPAGRLHLLDRALKDQRLLSQMADHANAWRLAKTQLDELTEQLERQQDQRDLMRHWVDELSEFAPEEGEFDALIEQRRHARETKSLRAALQRAETIIGSDRGMLSGMNELRSIALQTQESEPLHELLSRADQAIDGYLRHLQLCTADLAMIDEDAIQERLFRWRDLARKHRCQEAELCDYFERLQLELAQLDAPETALASARSAAQAALSTARRTAQKLSAARKRAAQAVLKRLGEFLPELGFQGAELRFELTQRAEPSALGWDELQILLQANPGEGYTPIQSGASGGEKARILLALDCSLPRTDALNTVFYDEVDAGMGGLAAAAVARLLRQQSQDVQVLVVTHQASVAAAAHQHLRVHKHTTKGRTHLQIDDLNGAEREREVVRMTSGDVAVDAAQVVARALLDEGGERATV